MEHGEIYGCVRLSPQERAVATEALVQAGYPETADALRDLPQTSEVEPMSLALIMKSVKRLSEAGHQDAETLINSYEALGLEV